MRVIVLEVNVLPSKIWIEFWLGLTRFYVTIPFLVLIKPFIMYVAKRLVLVKVKRQYR